ncbi:hypothetical protein [Sulfurovum sp.]|uniref:hypothetical protein n=1 Tax=Sulfurovum sp. TaxID=1969726 RepID=UPI003562EEFD
MKKEEMFSRLVENAFDFLFKAISEIKEQPKYSIIHFYAAVELLVKARLMHEHWSLVIAKKQEPDWDKFVAGDFQSVTLDEAATKLKKVVRSGLSPSEIEAFKEVANHRNKMVHFFHEAQSKEESEELTRKVVKQQLKAWHFLHQLLLNKWKNEFISWNTKISELDSALRQRHEFLQVVFDSLQPELKIQTEKGAWFKECPSCGFESKIHVHTENIIYESKCLVCGLVEKCLNIKCPECDEIITISEEETSPCCQSCKYELKPEDVGVALTDNGAAHIAAMEGDDSYDDANCSYCNGYYTVVRTENDKWVCTQCLRIFDSLERCEWCSDFNTGDMQNSYVSGCNCCDGMAGWRRDD